jgi:hypothetical protein
LAWHNRSRAEQWPDILDVDLFAYYRQTGNYAVSGSEKQPQIPRLRRRMTA